MAPRNTNYDGKRIIIVGASSGLGAELARQYAKLGKVKLVLGARRMERLEQVANECKQIRSDVEILSIFCDVTKIDQCENIVKKTVEAFQGIDLLIYNAGQAMHAKLEEITDIEKVANQMMNTNFYGATYTTYYAQRYLKESKGQIVVVSSVAGQISPPYLTFYAASKHALQGFFDSLRNEEPGFTVTVVQPGYVATEIDDKKVLGDGSVQKVELNVDPSTRMSVEKAAALIIDAQAKKKANFHLTRQGAIGTTLHSLFPGFINNQVVAEMKKITNVPNSNSNSNSNNNNNNNSNNK